MKIPKTYGFQQNKVKQWRWFAKNSKGEMIKNAFCFGDWRRFKRKAKRDLILILKAKRYHDAQNKIIKEY